MSRPTGSIPSGPSRFHSRFYHLHSLHSHYESLASDYLQSGSQSVLVDIGCGNMPYYTIFRPYVSEYFGADLADNARAHIQLEASGSTGLSEGFADVVLSTQVMEHVEDPPDYLSECFRILKPGGLLFLSTHGYWMYHPHPVDHWRWTSSGLCKLLESAGFEIIELQGIMGLAPTGIQLLQDALLPKVRYRLGKLFVLAMQSLIALTDRAHSAEEKAKDACTFVVVATKNETEHRRSISSGNTVSTELI